MEAYISEDLKDGTYDFFLTPKEILILREQKLQAPLRSRITKKDLGKIATLESDQGIIGECDLDTIPRDSCWDNATELTFRIKPYLLDNLQRTGMAQARWHYGDVFLYDSSINPSELPKVSTA